MLEAAWITPAGLGCQGSPWFIPSRGDLPREEVKRTRYTAGPICSPRTAVQARGLKPSILSQYTHTRARAQPRQHTQTLLKVISTTAASVCLQARQTANKRPISRAIHLWGCFAERVDLNGCRLPQEARLGWGDSTLWEQCQKKKRC